MQGFWQSWCCVKSLLSLDPSDNCNPSSHSEGTKFYQDVQRRLHTVAVPFHQTENKYGQRLTRQKLYCLQRKPQSEFLHLKNEVWVLLFSCPNDFQCCSHLNVVTRRTRVMIFSSKRSLQLFFPGEYFQSQVLNRQFKK